MSYYYRVYGLVIASDLECPELPPIPLSDTVDVRISIGKVLSSIEDTIDAKHRLDQKIYQFMVKGVARYRIEGGRDVWVYPFPGASAEDVRLFLLGTALGGVLHQRGHLPLHVCAVTLNGEAYAFCGESGAGKSTLAIALHRRGLPMFCDDVGVAIPNPAGGVLFYSGVPRIKLWQDTLDHLGINSNSLVRDQTSMDKFHIMLQDSFHLPTLPLHRLYSLERNVDSLSLPLIEPLSRYEAIGLLIEHTYRVHLVHQIGDARAHLHQCGQVAAAIGIFRYTRPWSLLQLESSVDRLLEHILAERIV